MQFFHVSSLDAAHAELARHGDDITVLAGGTDVMVQTHKGELRPRRWLSIGGIQALSGVRFTLDQPAATKLVTVGALTTHHQLWRDPLVRRSLPALAGAAATVGGWQTQAAGTIGGNVCNASPAADTMAPLLVANARAVLSSTNGTRELALADFVVGRRSTARRPDELLIALTVEPLPSSAAEVYLKVGPRSAMEVAVVGLAVRIALADNGRVVDARIALASVAPTVFRATEAEASLIGSSLDEESVEAAGEVLFATARPVDDARATASYRQRVLPQLLGRAIRQCVSQISGS